jgi:hypothetical protein
MYLPTAIGSRRSRTIRASVAEQRAVFDYPIRSSSSIRRPRDRAAKNADSQRAEPRHHLRPTGSRARSPSAASPCRGRRPAELDARYCAGRSDGLRGTRRPHRARARGVKR